MKKPQHPILMSYADDDKPPEAEGAVGWVTYFKAHVEAGLKEMGFKDRPLAGYQVLFREPGIRAPDQGSHE
jgi:hypothetical protein